MAGTTSGGKDAERSLKSKYGHDYYIHLGHKGGSAPYRGLKGFANNRELARIAGTLGGLTSRRGKPKRKIKDMKLYEEIYVNLQRAQEEARNKGRRYEI